MLHSKHCYIVVGKTVFSGISVGHGRNVWVICAEIVYLTFFFDVYLIVVGDRGGTVVKILRYKSEGHWFDSRWFLWNFSLT
jgi:hypothetical protein